MITETRTRRVEPDITILEISGRLNLGNSLLSIESAIQRLVEEGVRKLVVDIAGLHYIDSSGIGLLVTSSGNVEHSGGRMRIAGAQGAVARTLELVHVERITPLDADVESACRHLAGDSAQA
jgi:anti-sigma B factor antagonist